MSDTVPRSERHREQNNDWVLRDLYAYDKIDIYDIATYKIITYTKYMNNLQKYNAFYNLYQEQFNILSNQISEEKFTT